MQSLQEIEIFGDKLPSAAYLRKQWNLYIQHNFENSRRNFRVISISLFIFPGRVSNSNVDVYRNNVAEYITGIEGSLMYVHKCLPDWNVRIHVDYSVVAATRLRGPKHAGIRGLAVSLIDALEGLQQTYDKTMQIVAVRRKFPRGKERYTMFPAMYRFLPLFDQQVEVAMSSEADNPYNSLYHHFATDKWLKGSKRYMFIIPDSYDIEHCLVYIATHRRVRSPQLCPCMIWGAQKTEARGWPEDTIEDPRKFNEMLRIQSDKHLHYLFQNLSGIKNLGPNVSRSLLQNGSWQTLQKSKNYEDILNVLYTVTKKAISSVAGTSSKDDLVALCNALLRDDDSIMLAVFVIFSTVLSKFVPSAKWVVHFNFLDRVVPAVLSEAYGVDEWLVRLLFDSALNDGQAIIVTTSSPEQGLRFQDRRAIQNDDPGNTLRLLNDLQGGNWPPYGEVVARSLILLRLLWPHESPKSVEQAFRKMKSDYFKRLFLMSDSYLAAASVDFDAFYKMLDSLFYNEGFSGQAGRHIMQISDASSFRRFTQSAGVTFDQQNRRFKYTDIKGYNAVKSLLLKGCMLDMKMLHMFKISLNPQAQFVPW